MKERKKIIIFGATGNVGSYLTMYACNFFSKEEYEIIASGRRNTDFWIKKGIRYFSIDVTKKRDFEQLPTENVYAVILLSATIPAAVNEYNPNAYVDSIISGALNVLEYCRIVKADRILFAQTIFDVGKYPENSIIKPDASPLFSYTDDHAIYVICKNSAIELIKHYHETYGLKSFIFRFPSIYCYSPNYYFLHNGKLEMRPLYKQIFRAINSEPLEVWGNPLYRKEMPHVYDLSQMLCKAVLVSRESGFYNVGTGIPVTVEEQCRAIIDVFSPKEKPSEIIYYPEKPSGAGFLQLDITNAVQELGYKPLYDVTKIFQDFKYEMEVNTFKELRINE